MTQRVNRESNIELLRILAMFFILVQHANFLGIGMPTANECIVSPINSFIRFFIESLSIVAVNIFIFISGWFGIKSTVKKLCSFLFQVLFFTLSLLLIHGILYGWHSISGSDILKAFLVTKCYWFVKSYICLFILSPILNLFSEKASKRTFQLVLIGFFAVQSFFGWTDSAPEFYYGYSALSFIGLYLLARYLYLNPVCWLSKRKRCLISYIFLSAIPALAGWLLVRFDIYTNYAIPIAFSFINPVVILASIALFFVFHNSKAGYSKVINWIAVSTFSVYIIHINGFVFHWFQEGVWFFYSHFPIILRWLLVLCFLALVFIACVLFDKLRILAWKRIEYLFDKWPKSHQIGL